MNERETLMRKIQNASFICDETRMFLDTHPMDKNALMFFEKYSKVRRELIEEYTRSFGPILSDYVPCGHKWSWLDEPWPWQREV